ncbi:hypothetical protein ALP8811_02474 [Aliiroseovarius pelagivivens]|uniref:Lipoprotein n=1 Tax=Aliiroseovarius pelagivivens TaxID=1639690 RepID=A0A2R8ARQ1_9RHOB|nr:hypothetical protein [Aliiroseovarius pelagivivens]SPF78547.1 hypothetical protein ALP8811_02474 [Aliiroseovarius pelagivivens]
MKNLVILAGVAAFGLSGCVTPSGVANMDPNLKTQATLPPEVAATVAPGQDTSDIRIDARDGCLMYRHNGPVETTYIPLRNKKGRAICIKREA